MHCRSSSTTQSYLSNNSGTSGCCIGGYHNVSGAGQPYAMFTYIQKSGAFSQDVSALSHEIGEYVDDPNTNNTDVPPDCTSNRIYEVGDPLENEANYGDYAYVVNTFTYHLQDLVTPGLLRCTDEHQREWLEHIPGNHALGLPERGLGSRAITSASGHAET